MRKTIGMILNKKMSILALVLSLSVMFFHTLAFTNVLLFSDTEGSMSAIDAFVRHGKLKWEIKNGQRQLEFVNAKDQVVFGGDLNGPNWMDTKNPKNIELRDALLDFKKRHPARVDLVLGNHEYNRLKYIRDNALIDKGQHKDYNSWLKKNNIADSTVNRVNFWGESMYGLTKDGVPQPVDQYQKELSNRLNRPVTAHEAAEQFAKDLKIGKKGEPHGKMVQYLLEAQESTVRGGYAITHGPIQKSALGVVPNGESVKGGATWLRQRNKKHFEAERTAFVEAIQKGKIPSDILPNLGDARLDNVSRKVINDSSSVTYTERPRSGEQYRGTYREVAEAFMDDPIEPVKGIISGHKPAGNFPTAHRQDINGRHFLDVTMDVSRGPNGKNSILEITDHGDLQITHTDANGKVTTTTFGPTKNTQIGMITEDDFHVKTQGPDGEYILEKYKGYDLEQKTASAEELKKSKLSFSTSDAASDRIMTEKTKALANAISESGGQVLPSHDDAARIVKGRFVLDMRGASDWAALPEEKIQSIKEDLKKLASRLNPEEVVILTGGNRSQNPNAFESVVHDVFGGENAKKKFDIIGFMKHDTPVDEVDKSVKYVVLSGSGGNWDGPVQDALRFVQERKGASMMVGGGGTLRRSASSDIAASMKDRLFMFTGYGGASAENAAKGTPVASMDDFIEKISKLEPSTVSPPVSRIGKSINLDPTCTKKALLDLLN